MSERRAGGSQAIHAQETRANEMIADSQDRVGSEATAAAEEIARVSARLELAADAVVRSARSARFDSPAHAAARARRAATRGRARVALSVIVPLHDGAPCAREHIGRLAEEAQALVASYEILVIADARSREDAEALAERLAASPRGVASAPDALLAASPSVPSPSPSNVSAAARANVAIYALSHESGESAALRSAFRLARGSYVVTMPSAPVVAPGALARVLSRLRAGDALVLGRRSPAASSRALPAPPLAQRMLARASGLPLSDLGCGVRGMTRVVAKELADGGDLARFLPFLAHRNGHAVTEVVVEQAAAAPNGRHRGSHLHGLHDLFAVVFLLRFARAPLRLFGSVGAVTALAGALIAAGVAADRILNHTPLARRPILVLAVLLIVVGVQTIALGILGELTVFARSRRHREYRVERVLR